MSRKRCDCCLLYTSYDHDSDEGFSGDNYWPEEMRPETYYTPVERGFEKRIAERLAYWGELREKKRR